MALAYDAVSSTSGSGLSSVTLSHTCSGTDRILIVNAGVHGNARVVTGITYNGVAMTYATEQVNAGALAKVYQYYLIAPATGAHNIVVTYDGNADYSVAGISLTGADQTAPKGAVGGGTGTSASPSNTITTTFTNSMVIDGTVWAGYTAGDCSATGTNQTTRYAIANGGVFLEAGGSTQTTTSAGSKTSSWTGGTAAGYAQSLVEIKQVQGPYMLKSLVIGGGGGGGRYTGKNGGGGGAGGYLQNDAILVGLQAYTVTVGAGGAGSSADGTRGTKGGDSSFGSLLLVDGGGGGGSGNAQPAGGNGGSGGGAGADGGTQPGGTGNQNYASEGTNGGSGADPGAGGGGGGATAAGANGSGTVGGAGGAGTASSISGSSVTRGGGGGGAGSSGGAGGAGGGGAGATTANTAGTNGTANTGGGGGGARGAATGGTGGSGVVIISYVTANFGTCTGGTITTDGVNTVHTFTTSGTFTTVAPSTARGHMSLLGVS